MNGSAIARPRRTVACGFAAILLAGSGAFGIADVQSQEPIQASLTTPSSVLAPFSLVDQRGRPVTDKNFRGSFMLVYFGYTYCPDVCPLGLQRISQVIEALGAEGERIVPIFITVDPERDTGQVLAAYTSHFHPRLIGLTGRREQIHAAKRAYGVRSFKLFSPPSFDDESKVSDNSRYLMQHSASTYLVNPDGRLESIFPHEIPPREMARQIHERVVEYP